MNKIVSLWRKYLEIWREKNLIQIISKNTRIYNHSSGPHITHFSPVVAKERKNFEWMFILKLANIACRKQMTTVNLLLHHFKQL